MWEFLQKRPRGRVSRRHISHLVTSLVVAVLVCMGITKPAFAADVIRTTGGFTYQGKSFTTPVTIQPGDPQALSAQATGPVSAFEYMSPDKKKVEYLYFAQGVDPKTAATALYTSFDYKDPASYSNQSPSPPSTLTISDTPAAANTMTDNQSCKVPSVGWVVCAVSNFLATALDWAYSFVTNFLEVKPLAINNVGIYKIWDLIRSIANICFVITFLVVIFSQVTSLGISTYGVRKALPRLVVSAILVNLSFWICSLAIDISNFLGYSVYSLLKSITDTMTSIPDGLTVEYITQAILGGTAAAIGGTIWFAAAAGGSIIAGVFMLGSMLISAAFAVLVAFVILAARQGLIVIFTLISPLAFVAMVLPSTEKWAHKWREAFMTLLFMFPIFAILFGGSQIAGKAIIMGSSGSLLLVLLGFAVQMVPLFITPFLIKLSTGVLGTVANMVNNRNKGAVDRLKNWTNDQAEYHRQKALGQANKSRRPAHWLAQSMDNVRRRQELDKKRFEALGATRAMRTNGYRRSFEANELAGLEQGTAESNLKANYDYRRRTDPSYLRTELSSRAAQNRAKLQSEALETMHADIAAEGAASHHIQNLNITNPQLRADLQALSGNIRGTVEDIAFTGMAKKLAEAQHKSNVADRLNSDQALRESIGRVRGTEGAQLVHANAIAEERKQFGEFVSARQEIMKHFKVSSAETAQLAKGLNSVTKTDARGHSVTFSVTDDYTREAAIERVFEVGAYSDILQVIEATGQGRANHKYRATVQDSFIKSGKAKSMPFINDKALDLILNGLYDGEQTTREQAVRRIMEGRITASDLTTAHADAITKLFESQDPNTDWTTARNAMFGGDIAKAANYTDNYRGLQASAIEVLRDPQLRQATNRESIKALKRFLNITVESLDGYDWEALERRLHLRP